MTIKELNNRAWYRALKVLYISIYSFSLLFDIAAGLEEMIKYQFWDGLGIVFLGSIGIILFFEVMKRVFYYVVIGKVFPKQ